MCAHRPVGAHAVYTTPMQSVAVATQAGQMSGTSFVSVTYPVLVSRF